MYSLAFLLSVYLLHRGPRCLGIIFSYDYSTTANIEPVSNSHHCVARVTISIAKTRYKLL